MTEDATVCPACHGTGTEARMEYRLEDMPPQYYIAFCSMCHGVRTLRDPYIDPVTNTERKERFLGRR